MQKQEVSTQNSPSIQPGLLLHSDFKLLHATSAF